MNIKNIIMITLAMALPVANVHAQKALFLGDQHAMERISTASKYLLIPVEEAQENDHIRLIQDNKVVKEFNIRLAVSKIDYYVPLDLDELAEGNALLDININRGDASAPVGGRVDIKDFTCWKNIKYADSFDASNKEKFRPAYHHTPVYGWMNDPNGLFYKDGVWHLYFQYNPYGSMWENMTWGHSTSTDLIHWTQQPNAIEADAIGTIFSGSAVVDKNNTSGYGAGAVIAMYTSAGASQTQSMAYSTDNGKTFTKYADNPVLTGDVPDFRDPHMFWNEDTKVWNLVLAAGQEVRLYSSQDLHNWKYESSFGKGYGNHDGVWECPDLFKIGDKWILIVNINPGGPFGGSATQYFTGSFDGHQFTCDDKSVKWMDYGKDHYATVSFDNAPEGRRVVIPWMSNWQYANQVPTKQFRSANGLPRDLGTFTYKGHTYLKVTPSKELLALRGKKTNKPSATSEIVLNVKGNTILTLSNAKGEEVVMTYDAAKEQFSMDRSKSGDISFSDEFAATTTAPVYGKISQLRIFIDNSSIEAFDADGKMAMTNLVFPSEPYNKLSVKGKAKAVVYNLK